MNDEWLAPCLLIPNSCSFICAALIFVSSSVHPFICAFSFLVPSLPFSVSSSLFICPYSLSSTPFTPISVPLTYPVPVTISIPNFCPLVCPLLIPFPCPSLSSTCHLVLLPQISIPNPSAPNLCPLCPSFLCSVSPSTLISTPAHPALPFCFPSAPLPHPSHAQDQTATMSGDYEDDLCRRALVLVSDLCARIRDADTSNRCQEFSDRIRGYPRGPDADISVSLLSVIVTFCGIVLLGVSLFVSWKLCWVPWRDKGGSAVGGGPLRKDLGPGVGLAGLVGGGGHHLGAGLGGHPLLGGPHHHAHTAHHPPFAELLEPGSLGGSDTPEPSYLDMDSYPEAAAAAVAAGVKPSQTSPELPSEGGAGSGLLLLPPSGGGLPSAQSHQQVTSLAPTTRYPALPRPLTQQTLTSQPDPNSEERPPALPLPLPGGEEKAKLIGQIKPELYQGTGPGGRRGGGAPGSGEAGTGAPCGRISFALRYLYGSDQLVVRILQALDLPAKDSNGFSDPYVKIYLLPDRKKKFQTKVHRKTLNPVFNETFQFSVPLAELAQRKLHFSVYDFDRFSRHDLIGQVVLDNLLELAEQPPDRPLWRDIVEGGSEKADLGELNFSLCYLPTAGRLTVTIIKASNLKAMDLTGFSDPYVKASLISEGRRLKKRKTSIKKNTLNPTYNEALVFDVAPESVENVGLSIAVVDYDCIGHNEVIGVCRVGPDAADPHGREHWAEMLANPRKPVEHWHQLVEEKTLTSFTKGSKGLSEKENSE
ncbi:PREDICTED: synaptotagmin-3 isoform X1 [Cercocebus atys]|nr:PREDICTED: synaptotagmin-3 isoform X1 [Cercocebus atys]XP_011936390.1 PREDICTED: synaptotagmin-3 isoform X1 [Cercocebus atys]